MNDVQRHREQLNGLQGRPSLLFHVCCGVCSVWPLVYLRNYFRITIYYGNSNIYPESEYERRLETLEEYLEILNDPEISLVIPPYDSDSYMKELSLYDDHQEGGKRCCHCYEMRMKEAYDYAEENHYDYFTTVMSISSRKRADYLNEIGGRLDKEHAHTRYLYADFKKDGGITKNEEMNKELHLYHQSYCGCVYSRREE